MFGDSGQSTPQFNQFNASQNSFQTGGIFDTNNTIGGGIANNPFANSLNSVSNATNSILAGVSFANLNNSPNQNNDMSISPVTSPQQYTKKDENLPNLYAGSGNNNLFSNTSNISNSGSIFGGSGLGQQSRFGQQSNLGQQTQFDQQTLFGQQSKINQQSGLGQQSLFSGNSGIGNNQSQSTSGLFNNSNSNSLFNNQPNTCIYLLILI